MYMLHFPFEPTHVCLFDYFPMCVSLYVYTLQHSTLYTRIYIYMYIRSQTLYNTCTMSFYAGIKLKRTDYTRGDVMLSSWSSYLDCVLREPVPHNESLFSDWCSMWPNRDSFQLGEWVMLKSTVFKQNSFLYLMTTSMITQCSDHSYYNFYWKSSKKCFTFP